MTKALDDTLTYVSIPITKYEETGDGNLIVYGRATDGSVDSDEQIVDPAWSAKALARWLDTGGNVRVSHNPQLYPAGRGLSVEPDRDGDGAHWVKSLVVEPTAKELVRHKVLRAYSVGISQPVIKRDITGKARGGIVTGGDNTEIAEISLVDRPANRNCGITLAKAHDDGLWTYGDLADLLEKAKKHPPVDDEDDDEEDDEAGEDEATTEDADADDDDPDGDSDDDVEDDGQGGATTKAYRAACAAWKAREPQPNYADPGPGTTFLAKQAAAEAWRRWDAEGADLDGSADAYARWTAKRRFDANVGGGVDRDQIPDGDHIDPTGRRFPIVTPADVSDAVSSYGRANPAIPMRKFRKRLEAIAARKGPDFVAQLPTAWGDAAKNITTTAPLATGLVPFNLAGQQQPAAGDEDEDEDEDRDNNMAIPDITKAGAKACRNCGENFHADTKLRRCTKCGKKLPKADIAKNHRLVPPDVRTATEHREPDGPDVEALEHDAGLPTVPDAARSAAPYTVKRMHDALCAAYPWGAVADTYPSLTGPADAVVPGYFADAAATALASRDLKALAKAATIADTADQCAAGAFEPAALDDARAEVHKAFSAMYPTVTLKPGAPPAPGQFQRPYLSAGHAAASAATSTMPAMVPPTAHTIHPDDFSRPLVTDGHEAESPTDAGDNLLTPTVASGASRIYYRNASRDAARNAMQAMHDHIATTFPDLCAMAPGPAMVDPDMGATNRPHPTVMPPAPSMAPAHKGNALTADEVDQLLTKRLRKVEKTYRRRADEQEQTIAALRAEVDELGAQPDPAQAPMRGVVRPAPATLDKSAAAVPAERTSLVEKAQRDRAVEDQQYLTYLTRLADVHNPNPQQREQAEAVLRQLATTS